jgi:hypothetical protein
MTSKYGRLTPTGVVKGKAYVACRCSCGAMTNVRADHLTSGKIRSCGCLARELLVQRNTTHGKAHSGKARTPEYRAWAAMNSRCHNPNDDRYKDYGGRGIRVHRTWRTPAGFLRFLEHIGPHPGPKYSLDRKENRGHYCPGNVRWATKTEQARNRRSNHLVLYQNEVKTLVEWCMLLTRNYKAVWSRLHAGWTIARALETPTRST